jgi:hypothetical protein
VGLASGIHLFPNLSAVIIIKSTAMLRIALFHNENMCLVDAPYLDSYGQTDPGFKFNRRMYLNEFRHNDLKRLVIGHGIPSLVAKNMLEENMAYRSREF